MHWFIRNIRTHRPIEGFFFKSLWEARTHIDNMGPAFQKEYDVICETGDSKLNRMINEGMVKGDLQNILLPLLSIDEYIPASPETDNIVLAFFIKGVPEAVFPFKNFCEKSDGVLAVDYGDSDTIVNTSIVYVEFDREALDIQDIHDLVVQTSMLAQLEPEDFTVTFPHTNKKYPYEPRLLKKYFTSRSERENRLAQIRAQREAEKEKKREFERMQAARQEQQARQEIEEPEAEEAAESLANSLANALFE